MGWLLGGIMLACLGILFIVDPSQFLVNNEIMARKVKSGSGHRWFFKILAAVFIFAGMLFILKYLIK